MVPAAPQPPQRLDDASLAAGYAWLARVDPDLAAILERFGPPPLWARPPGFPTLIHIILEQQVSLASALAAYKRLREKVDPLSPQGFLALDDPILKAIGFSRQKTAYSRYLAQAILAGELDLAALETADDETVRRELTRLKGIGAWSSEIYLLMALLRPDVWPAGDLALAAAVRRVKSLEKIPNPLELEQLGQPFRPWRAAAARLFWYYYLDGVE
ncbi:MAG TPA: hypothetical protein VMT46_09590 [Anaerolineaceae bacterium]|nr:hypothetical protein [Anaerolineaceae bacterium]